MNFERKALHDCLCEVFKAESALWFRSDCPDAKAALGKCIDHLNYRDASCVPEVRDLLELAHAAVLGHKRVEPLMTAIRRALMHLQTIQEKAPRQIGA